MYALLYLLLIIFLPLFRLCIVFVFVVLYLVFSISYLYFTVSQLRLSALQALLMPDPGRIFDNIGGGDFVGRVYCCLSRIGAVICSPLSRPVYYFFTSIGRAAPSPAFPESLDPTPAAPTRAASLFLAIFDIRSAKCKMKTMPSTPFLFMRLRRSADAPSSAKNINYYVLGLRFPAAGSLSRIQDNGSG